MISKKHLTRAFTFLISSFLLLLLTSAKSPGQLKYEEGDWVSYTNFNQVTDIEVGRDFIYLATSGGVLRYHRYRKRWEDPWVVVRGFDGPVDLRSAANVDYIEETDEVAVLTTRGAFLYNPIFKYWVTTEHTFDPVLQADLKDAVFLDLPDYTVSHRTYFLQGDNTIMDSNLLKYSLTVFADDTWGHWWIGLENIGVLMLDIHTKRGTIWELGLYGNDVRSMARGKGWTILSGHNRSGGITFWKRRANIWDHLEPVYTAGLESTWINDVAVFKDYALFATDYGLTRVNLKNGTCNTWTVFDGLWSNRTSCVAVAGDTAWVGTEDGVCKITLPKGPVKRLDNNALRNQMIYRIAADRDAVWIGGELGVYRLDRKSGEGYYLGLEGGVGGAAYDLHSGKDEIWVGRMSGVEVVDKQSLKQTGFPSQAFMNGAEVYAIYAEDSLVWVGTKQGLWKFDRSRNYWHQYTGADGLLDNRVYTIYPDGDYLLLGTASGVTRFFWNDPHRVD